MLGVNFYGKPMGEFIVCVSLLIICATQKHKRVKILHWLFKALHTKQMHEWPGGNVYIFVQIWFNNLSDCSSAIFFAELQRKFAVQQKKKILFFFLLESVYSSWLLIDYFNPINHFSPIKMNIPVSTGEGKNIHTIHLMCLVC